MTEEEKKAISMCNLLLNGDITLHIIDDDGGTAYAGIVNKEYNEDLRIVLNLIQKQSKVIDEMAKEIEDFTGSCPKDTYDFSEIDCENICGIELKECWKQYFYRKVENEDV